jgi:hypothetical protein
MLLAQKLTIHQWNTIENTKINPHTYNQMMFYKMSKTYIREKIVFSINIAGKTKYTGVKG